MRSSGDRKQMARPAIESLWSVVEIARYLGVSTKGAYRLAERGAIPCVKIGGRLRFDPDEVRAWVRQQHTIPWTKHNG